MSRTRVTGMDKTDDGKQEVVAEQKEQENR